jgi:hypothetical protein
MIWYFRVLILDDDDEVIKRMRERIRIDTRSFEGRTYRVDLRPVHVSVESTPGPFLISPVTIEALVSACSDIPHLILADFGYAQKGVMDQLLKIADGGKQLTEEDLAGKLLTTADLATAARRYADDPAVDSYKRRILRRNFLEYDSKLCLYSYVGRAAVGVLGQVEARANRTRAAFVNCTVVPYDTKYLFYNGSEFDWPASPSKHDSRFYAHLVTGLIDNIIRQEFLEFILTDTKRLKYVRLKKTAWSVGFIVALGGALGAVSEWIGGRVLGLATTGFQTLALTFGVLTILWLFGIGLLLPVLFERVMSRLLADGKHDQSE